MKKYIRPDISFQQLSLSTDVSAGCSQQAQFDPNSCKAQIPGNPGLFIFHDGGDAGCNIFLPNPEDFICYHVPTADTNVFSS